MRTSAVGAALPPTPNDIAAQNAGDDGSAAKRGNLRASAAPDRVDRTGAAPTDGSQNVAVQIPDHPQGDVYAAEGRAAIWQAYYLQQPDGFSSGRGPKPPGQMAFIIKRNLQQDFDAARVPIHFSAVARPRENLAAYVISGRDATNSGVEVTVNKDGSTQMTSYEFGKPQATLKETYRWHPEKHDTGYLERLIRGHDRPAWVPDNGGNVMTGKDL